VVSLTGWFQLSMNDLSNNLVSKSSQPHDLAKNIIFFSELQCHSMIFPQYRSNMIATMDKCYIITNHELTDTTKCYATLTIYFLNIK